MTELIVPLIMCGGAGTRLWPASREGLPKQFLPLFGRLSTFQETIRRVSDPALFGRPIIRRDGSPKNAEDSGASMAKPMRTRLAAPLPAGIGNRTTWFFSSQSKSAGWPPAISGPLGVRESWMTTSPATGALNSHARMPFSYSIDCSSAVA